jgi:hypothetical protein
MQDGFHIQADRLMPDSGEDGGPLAARKVAAAIAPIIDRLRVSISRRVPQAAGRLLAEFELTPEMAQTISMLRNLLGGRATCTANVLAAFAYTPRQDVSASLTALAEGSFITIDAETISLSERGSDLLVGIRSAMQDLIEDLWSGIALTELAALAGRAVESASLTGGAAFALVAPPYEPPGTPPATLLAERLTPLRFHRYDAHAAAWRAAGLTAAQARMLPPGPQREQIEAATNDAAAAPYLTLSPDERFHLCAGLGSLPN